ncbi:hypothetical protein HYG86_15750 [Alkalicella caledoniensis]|uniref:Uncharacterized protein n=1 Tax=Alkalicella caledoniensis TaxID=2731377 RepID=A0A7G9WBQ6_ALKCA|nr:hypothetical protein [Alkalicella caledoniensis]QNO16118.1 hypothetical protein HYG86_15750 [Alkalicella caledoniensis]
MKKAIALILLTIITLTLSPSMASADEKIKATYTSNFGQGIQRENWNRVEVEIENQGDQDFTGQVEVDAGGKYIQEIFIERGKKITVEFYIPPMGVENINQVDVYVKNKNNKAVSSHRFSVSYYRGSGTSHYIGVVSKNPDRFKRIQNFIDLETVPMKEEHFNNHLFMENLGTIIIDELDNLTLSAQQKENLELWLKRGGNLVIGGGRTTVENTSIINPDIMPYRVSNNLEKELNIPFFEGKSNVLFTSGEVLGDIALGTEELPLIITKDTNQGRVVFSTINFADSFFDNVNDFEKYLEAIILSNPPRYQGTEYRVGEANRLLTLMSVDLGGLNFLSPGFLFFGLIAYILLVGPFNFAMLKKYNKMDYGWITIPALSVVFTIILFLVGSTGRSKDMANTQLNVIEYFNNGTAYVESYNNFFMPNGRTKKMQANFLSVAPTTNGLTLINNTTLETSQARIWSNQRAVISTTKNMSGPIVKLELLEKETAASITNNYDYEIFDGYLVVGDRWYRVGEISPGETKKLSLKANSVHVDYQSLFQRLGVTSHMYSQVIESMALSSGNYTFIAFDDKYTPIEFQGSPITKLMNFSIVHQNNMEIDIKETTAVSNISAVVSKVDFQHYDNWRTHQYYISGAGEMEMVFELPKGVDYQGFTGRVNINGFRAYGNVEYQVLNQETSQWEKHQVGGMGGSFDLPKLENYVRNNILSIKLVISDENSNVDLELSGIKFSVIGGATND